MSCGGSRCRARSPRPDGDRGRRRNLRPQRGVLKGLPRAPSPEAWGRRGLRGRARPRAGGFGHWVLAPACSGRTEACCSRAPSHQEAHAAPPPATSTCPGRPRGAVSGRLSADIAEPTEPDALGVRAGPGGGCWAGSDLGFTFSDLNLCPGGSTRGPGGGGRQRLHSHAHARLWPPGLAQTRTCTHAPRPRLVTGSDKGPRGTPCLHGALHPTGQNHTGSSTQGLGAGSARQGSTRRVPPCALTLGSRKGEALRTRGTGQRPGSMGARRSSGRVLRWEQARRHPQRVLGRQPRGRRGAGADGPRRCRSRGRGPGRAAGGGERRTEGRGAAPAGVGVRPSVTAAGTARWGRRGQALLAGERRRTGGSGSPPQPPLQRARDAALAVPPWGPQARGPAPRPPPGQHLHTET